jgi:hypothetical protein
MDLDFPVVFGRLAGSAVGYHLYVNVNLRAERCQCRSNGSTSAAGSVGDNVLARAPLDKSQTTERGAEAPLEVSVACSFLFSGGLLLFLAPAFFAFLSDPHSGSRANVFF